MTQMQMKTHGYLECPQRNGKSINVLANSHALYNYDCDECEEYYLTEIHPDLCEGSDCWYEGDITNGN